MMGQPSQRPAQLLGVLAFVLRIDLAALAVCTVEIELELHLLCVSEAGTYCSLSWIATWVCYMIARELDGARVERG
jgi:hypothetical protein